MDLSILIAYNLEKYRKSENLTQRKLSSELHSVSKSAITLYEKNKRTPSVEIQEKICEKLNISLEVLNGQEQKNILINMLRNTLLNDKISASEYQYVYNYFSKFFNNAFYFSLKNITLPEYEHRAKIYFEKQEQYIYTYIKNEHLETEKAEILTNKIFLFLNNFIFLAVTLKERLPEYACLNSTIPIIKKVLQRKELDIEFFRIFVELKPIYTEILTKLNEEYATNDVSLALYFKNTNNIIGYISIRAELLKSNPILSAIKVDDNFMSPKFNKDDTIIVKEYSKYEDGQIVAITNEKNDILIGKLKNEDSFIILQPINTNYTPITFTKEKMKFLGKIIEVRYY